MKEATQPSMTAFTEAVRAGVLCSIFNLFLHVAQHLGLCIYTAPPSFFAKPVLFIVVPSWHLCRGSRGRTLWEAAVWCAIHSLEPWSGGEVMHGLNPFISYVWLSSTRELLLLNSRATILFDEKNILMRYLIFSYVGMTTTQMEASSSPLGF